MSIDELMEKCLPKHYFKGLRQEVFIISEATFKSAMKEAYELGKRDGKKEGCGHWDDYSSNGLMRGGRD